MSVAGITRIVENGYQAYGVVDQYLNIKQYISIVQSALQHPAVVSFRVLKNVKHCYDMIPATCKNWRDLFKLSQRIRTLTHSFGAEAELVKFRVLYKVVAVTGSFLCIVGALGQFGFMNSPRLCTVARLVDLVGLALLLVEPCIGHVLHHREIEAEKRHDLLEEQQSELSIPYSTCALQAPSPQRSPSRRHVIREGSYAQMQLNNPISYTNLTSYACYFVARLMHLIAICAFVNFNRKWVIVRTVLETTGLVLSCVSPAKISYKWACRRLRAHRRHVNLVKRVLICFSLLVVRVLSVGLVPQRLRAV